MSIEWKDDSQDIKKAIQQYEDAMSGDDAPEFPEEDLGHAQDAPPSSEASLPYFFLLFMENTLFFSFIIYVCTQMSMNLVF